jgi:hydrogenase nickel incorporation protein HypA/HybF
MHELSVTENILEIACSYAEKSKAARVTQVNLVIGRLSSIIDDSVQFYWDPIAEGTICSGSKLSFKRLPAILHCVTCDKDYQIEEELTPCPTCEGYQTTIVSGEEFFVESIEIEQEAESIQ